MTARIVANGRTVWADRDYIRQARRTRRPLDVPVDIETGQIGPDGEPLVLHSRTPWELNVTPIRQLAGVVNGRPVWGPVNGYRLIDEHALAAKPMPQPFLEGAPYFDEDENTVYRRVASQDPGEGWATTAFWQHVLKCSHDDVLRLAQRGLIDASIRVGSDVRRYRSRTTLQQLRESGLLYGTPSPELTVASTNPEKMPMERQTFPVLKGMDDEHGPRSGAIDGAKRVPKYRKYKHRISG